MEKLHHLGLLFLNFGVLNILLSLCLFLASVAGRRFIVSPYVKSRLFFLALLAPPALSAVTIFSSFAPPLFIKIPGKAMFCLNEPYCYIFSLISPEEIPLFNGLLITAVALAVIPVIYSIISIGSYLRAYATIHKLMDPSSPVLVKEGEIRTDVLEELKELSAAYKIGVKVIETPCTLSFIWGYFSNILVLSTGALKTLSREELRCLLAHELSHYKRRDNILKGFLLLCRNSLFIFPQVHYLLRWWRGEIELIGDEEAALTTGRPLDVASALLKMRRTPYSDIARDLAPHAIGFSMDQDDQLFTDRVERLIAISDGRIRPENNRWSIIPSEIGLLAGMASMFPLSFIVISRLDPLLVHCYLEKLTNLL